MGKRKQLSVTARDNAASYEDVPVAEGEHDEEEDMEEKRVDEPDAVTIHIGTVEQKVERKAKVTRRPWSTKENSILSKTFSKYIAKEKASLHNEDLKEVAKRLDNRTLPQIRTKLNSINIGKSKI